jgi:hypothetical protein
LCRKADHLAQQISVESLPFKRSHVLISLVIGGFSVALVSATPSTRELRRSPQSRRPTAIVPCEARVRPALLDRNTPLLGASPCLRSVGIRKLLETMFRPTRQSSASTGGSGTCTWAYCR